MAGSRFLRILVLIGVIAVLLLQVPSGSSAVAQPVSGRVALAPDPPLMEYLVNFTETGLPTGTTWSADLGSMAMSGSGPTLQFRVGNGTYSFSIPAVPSPSGGASGWEATPGSGTVIVNGSAVSQPLTFGPTPIYLLEFDESGLPGYLNYSFSVTIGAKTLTASSIDFWEPAGLVNFVITPPPNYGVVKISRLSLGPPVTFCSGTLLSSSSLLLTGTCVLLVTFGELISYTVVQANLPAYDLYPGAFWSVSLLPVDVAGGPTEQFNASDGSRVGFEVPLGGIYYFFVHGPPGYRMIPSKGELRVPASPGPLSQTVKFVLLTSVVKFKETGLTRGTRWNVTILDGTSPAIPYPLGESGPGPQQLVFRLPAGTYTWLATVPGTSMAPVAGTVHVSYPSRPISVGVPFSPSAGAAGCFVFTTDGAPVGALECNANANDILVNFTQVPGAVCANQFTLGGANDGPFLVCPTGANQLEVNWTGSAMGPVVPSCYWAVSGVVVGTCPVPSPAPNGFVLFLAEITSVSWTVNGQVVGTPIPAPAVANGVEFFV